MAVSRWFSAASLEQVSNMAITGSGSLAISFSLFVISAAFLPKGELLHLIVESGGKENSVSVMRVSHHRSRSQLLFCIRRGEEVVVRLCASMRTSFSSSLSITFSLVCKKTRLLFFLSFLFSMNADITGRVFCCKCTRAVIKKEK